MINRTAFFLLALLAALASSAARAQNCDCSCSAFSSFEASVVQFESQLDQGDNAELDASLQSQLLCLTPCAEQWMQCPIKATSRSDLRPSATDMDHPQVQLVGMAGQPPLRP